MNENIFLLRRIVESLGIIFIDFFVTLLFVLMTNVNVFSAELFLEYDVTTSPLDIIIMLLFRAIFVAVVTIRHSWVALLKRKAVMIYGTLWIALLNASFVKVLTLIVAGNAELEIVVSGMWGLLVTLIFPFYIQQKIWEWEYEILSQTHPIKDFDSYSPSALIVPVLVEDPTVPSSSTPDHPSSLTVGIVEVIPQ